MLYLSLSGADTETQTARHSVRKSPSKPDFDPSDNPRLVGFVVSLPGTPPLLELEHHQPELLPS